MYRIKYIRIYIYKDAETSSNFALERSHSLMYNDKNMRDETRIEVLKCFDTWNLQHVIRHFKSALKSYTL